MGKRGLSTCPIDELAYPNTGFSREGEEGVARAAPGNLGCVSCDSSENRSTHLCANPWAALLDNLHRNKLFSMTSLMSALNIMSQCFVFLGGRTLWDFRNL